jgi:hypothetical protein
VMALVPGWAIHVGTQVRGLVHGQVPNGGACAGLAAVLVRVAPPHTHTHTHSTHFTHNT